MSGDYGRFQPIYGMSIVDVDLPSVIVSILVPKSSVRTICVQKIVFVPTTYAAATLLFTDSISGLTIAEFAIPSTPNTLGDGSNTFTADFGPTGTKLTLGASLNMTGTVATGRLHIEAYQKGPYAKSSQLS